MIMWQELLKCAPLYLDACNAVHLDRSVDTLLIACRLPSVVNCCGESGVGAAVLLSAVQVMHMAAAAAAAIFSVICSH